MLPRERSANANDDAGDDIVEPHWIPIVNRLLRFFAAKPAA
jgi:hypothetical protein